MDRAEKAERERATADKLRLEALQEVERLRAFARQVESIMDSICGAQAFNWSEHAYPLRAALDAAGFPGRGPGSARWLRTSSPWSSTTSGCGCAWRNWSAPPDAVIHPAPCAKLS
jgi:hypothetical protein